MIERRLAALVLVAVGVALNWGIGWGLIAAGIGVALSGVDFGPVRGHAGRLAAEVRVRVRAGMAGVERDPVPRRTIAAALVAVGVVSLAVCGFLFLGAGGAAAGVAVGGIGSGAALGHEA